MPYHDIMNQMSNQPMMPNQQGLGLMGISPQNQGLLTAAAQLLEGGGPSLTPTSLGQNLGRATMAGMQSYNQGRQQALQNALMKRKLAREDQLGQAAGEYFADNPALAEIAKIDPQLATQLQRSGQSVNPTQWELFKRQAAAAGLEPGSSEYQRSARIALGLEGRASSAGYGFKEVVGPDGRTRLVRVDPRTGQVISPEESGTDFAVSRPEEESARLVETETTRGETQALREREAPAAANSVRYSIAQSSEAADTARLILDHPGLDYAVGTGGELIANVTPGSPAADAQALINQLKNRTFVAALQAMREASKTGGAVGNVSEAEGDRMESAFVSLEQAQSPEQFRRELNRFINIMEEGQRRIRQAYFDEYGTLEGAPTIPGVGEGSARGVESKATLRYNPETGQVEPNGG